MKQKSIKKNMLMNTILTVSNFIFPLITYSYVARVLTPTGTGQVAFVDSILAIFIHIAALGITAYGRRESAKVRDNRKKISQLVQELFIFNTGSTIIAYITLFLTVLCVPKLRAYSTLFLVMGFQIALKLIGFEWLYEGLEEYSYITKRSLAFKTISVALTFLLIHSQDDVLWYGFVQVFALCASYICNFINIRKYVDFKKTETYNLRRHIKPMLILFSATIAITIYANFDVAMIGFISSDREVGIYNAALKIKNIVLAISTAVTAVLVPRMAYYFENKDNNRIVDLLSKSLRLALLTSFPIAIYIMLFGSNVISFVAGQEYVEAIKTLYILMLCVFALVLTNLFGAQLLIPIGREKRYSQSVYGGLFINLGLNILLIPSMGAFGAAIGTLVTEVWNVIWMGSGCWDYVESIFKRISFPRYFIPMFISSVLSYVTGRCISNNGIYFQLIVTIIVFFGSYYTANIILREPLMLQIIKRMRNRIRKREE